MTSPIFELVWLSPPFYATILYIGFVYFGKGIMKTYPLFQNRIFEWMIAYNIYQTALNTFCFFGFAYEVYISEEMTIWGNTTAPHYTRLLMWIHYNNKYLDMVDTVFLLVSKKFTNVSLLHVFQRLLLMWFWAIVCRSGYPGDYYFLAMACSGVNILTYGYYLIQLLGVALPWHAVIILLHRLEYFICAIHSVYLLIFTNTPPLLAILYWFAMINLLVIFTNFHFDLDEYGNPIQNDSKKDPRIVFSFDSSGWLYIYHFGVALYIQKHIVPACDKTLLAFSGASGGSLVAACLAGDVSIRPMAEYVLSKRDACASNPFLMLPEAEKALHTFILPHHAELCSDRLRVLLTKVSWRHPPFIMGEVKSQFSSCENLRQVLRASCHIPLLGGTAPYEVKGSGHYYDGFFWSANFGFVPWRAFTGQDTVVKVSSISGPGASIKPKFPFPPWYASKKAPPSFQRFALFPPSTDHLEGMMALGYLDAAKYFSNWSLTPVMKTEALFTHQDKKVQGLLRACKSQWEIFGILFVCSIVLVILSALSI